MALLSIMHTYIRYINLIILILCKQAETLKEMS